MATINASPESFHAGSVAATAEDVAAAVRRAEAAGAALIDIGAMSTAPYKDAYIPESAEIARMSMAVAAARAATGLPISADTQRAAVAEAALSAGANMVNDVSALADDPAMGEVIARHGAGVVLMARENEGLDEAGESPGAVVVRLLREGLDRARAAGIANERIILDPGIGFFRRRSIPWHEWDLELLRDLPHFRALGYPLLVGASRKSFIGRVLGHEDPARRLYGSLAVAAWAHAQEVEWIRVHDVAETRDVLAMLDLVARPPSG